MRRPVRRLLTSLALAAALAGVGAFARPARADGPAPSAESQLKDWERAILKRKYPTWDTMDAAAREKVARNALALRKLTPDQLATLRARAGKIDPATTPARIENFGHFAPGDRRVVPIVMLVGAAVVSSLPDEVRAALDPGAPGAIVIGVERAAFQNCLAKTWFREAIKGIVAAAPLSAEPSPGAPPDVAQAFREARDAAAAVATGTPRPAQRELLRKFAEKYVHDRILAASRAAPADGTLVERGRALAQHARPQFAAAFDAAQRLAAVAVAGGHDRVVALCEAEILPMRERRLAELFGSLEKARTDGLLGSAAATHVEALQASILVTLKIPELQVQELAAAKTPRERREAILRINVLRRHLLAK